MRGLILGDACAGRRVAGLRHARRHRRGAAGPGDDRHLTPEATVWISDPTWPNHAAIIDHLSQKSAHLPLL
jgi:aspartate aminotransferase